MFELIRTQKIDSLNLEAQEYLHPQTGARHFHLASDDTNNAFMVAFPTVPEDSTGVAHILEHTTLCGSEKYPVRDPFFMMIRRSLNTFMNAMTSSDWTAYPFASQSRKDFDNLLQVYLDAVFFPRLDPLDFAQEGHRVEFEEADNPDSALVFKGVVYNEMKGAMSSPVSQLWQASSSALFPTTTYHYNSGGEPANIPDLTYDQLKEFHALHYHPSNSVIITYGNFPVEEHQKNIHQWALSRFEKKNLDFSVPDEKRYTQPQNNTIHYPLDEDETDGKTHLVMHWLLGRVTDLESMLNMQLMSGILLDNSSSPLRLALEKTDLATSPSDLCGLDNSSHESSFICGVEGTDPDNADALEALILNVLKDVAENGVAEEMVESVLHQFELEQREVSSGSYPYGLRLAGVMLPIAMHSGDPIAALDLDPQLNALREKIKDPEFIKKLVKTHLLDNPHRVRTVMIPDLTLSDQQHELENTRLEQMKSAMDDDAKQRVVDLAKALDARQDAVDDPEILPKVEIKDVPKDIPIPDSTVQTIASYDSHWYDQPTNGLAYESVIIPLPELSSDELDLLNLYSDYLTELGAGDKNYLQMQAEQSAVSGGVHASISLRGATNDAQTVKGFLRISASGLVRKHADFAQLIHTHLQNPRFDEHDRLQELIAQSRTSREAAITSHGQSLAMAAAASGISPAAKLGNDWGGLTGIKSLIELDSRCKDPAAILAYADRLASLHEKITQASRSFLVVAEGEHHAAIANDLSNIWSAPHNVAGGQLIPAFSAQTIKQAWLTSTQVNFCAKAYSTVPSGHPDAVVFAVLGRFLHNGYLHTAIREKGGAYGSGATYDSGSGSFRFYSYRDPRLTETLDDFDRSLSWLLDTKHDYQKLEEAILGVISAIDRPSSPAGEAIQTHMQILHGRSPAYRRANRQAVLNVTIADLQRVTETYLKPEQANIGVLSKPSSREKLEKAGLEIHNLQTSS